MCGSKNVVLLQTMKTNHILFAQCQRYFPGLRKCWNTRYSLPGVSKTFAVDYLINYTGYKYFDVKSINCTPMNLELFDTAITDQNFDLQYDNSREILPMSAVEQEFVCIHNKLAKYRSCRVQGFNMKQLLILFNTTFGDIYHSTIFHGVNVVEISRPRAADRMFVYNLCYSEKKDLCVSQFSNFACIYSDQPIHNKVRQYVAAYPTAIISLYILDANGRLLRRSILYNSYISTPKD